MEINGVRIFVDDLQAAVDFYRDVLRIPIKWDMSDRGAVGFDLGIDLIVEHADPDGDEGDLVGRFAGISLSVSHIEKTYRELSGRGVMFVSPPRKQFWGGVLAHFKDPAGNVLTLLGAGDS